MRLNKAAVDKTSNEMTKMDRSLSEKVKEAKEAAVNALLHNVNGRHGLPRTAGWGYHEPYTRDLMIAAPGIVLSGNGELIESMRKVFQVLALNQTERGHIPSLVDDPEGRGASDTTPLFILGLGIFRKGTGESDFLDGAAKKAIKWMEYQSPGDSVLVAQLPTSDWRDEQWVLGYGLFVNTVVYSYLKLYDLTKNAEDLKNAMSHFTITGDIQHRHVHEGLTVKNKPYYALWAYKIYSDERFDLLGNSLAILSGIASKTRAGHIISWVESECTAMTERGDLHINVGLPPNFFPFIRDTDPDWRKRYEHFNRPGDYHNGGVWPFICGFYIAALVAAGKIKLAEKKLDALTSLVSMWKKERHARGDYGFNEWINAQSGKPMGEDWQTWSAAMYLYAAECVERRETPFFDIIRSNSNNNDSHSNPL
jgi:hypothetical protein